MGISDLCHICGKGPEDFVTLRQFKIHFKKHEGPVNCPVCTKDFKPTKEHIKMKHLTVTNVINHFPELII